MRALINNQINQHNDNMKNQIMIFSVPLNSHERFEGIDLCKLENFLMNVA
jgi:hypothetical protein